jgi:hypothetical protein
MFMNQYTAIINKMNKTNVEKEEMRIGSYKLSRQSSNFRGRQLHRTNKNRLKN